MDRCETCIGELVFTNSDARPKVAAMMVAEDAVPQIMAWYGAFYAGDRYRVTFEGRVIAKDQNGEPVNLHQPKDNTND